MEDEGRDTAALREGVQRRVELGGQGTRSAEPRPQRREAVHEVEGVHERPAEGDDGEAIARARLLALGGAPAQPGRVQEARGAGGQGAAGRPEAGDMHAESRERLEASTKEALLLVRRELAPGLVRPGVVADLVAARLDAADRVRIALAVDGLDEEG